LLDGCAALRRDLYSECTAATVTVSVGRDPNGRVTEVTYATKFYVRECTLQHSANLFLHK